MRIGHRSGQATFEIIDMIALVGDRVDRGRASAVVVAGENLVEQFFVHVTEALLDPHRFAKLAWIAALSDPLVERRVDFVLVAITQLATYPIAGSQFVRAELLQQFVDRLRRLG